MKGWMTMKGWGCPMNEILEELEELEKIAAYHNWENWEAIDEEKSRQTKVETLLNQYVDWLTEYESDCRGVGI